MLQCSWQGESNVEHSSHSELKMVNSALLGKEKRKKSFPFFSSYNYFLVKSMKKMQA